MNEKDKQRCIECKDVAQPIDISAIPEPIHRKAAVARALFELEPSPDDTESTKDKQDPRSQ